MRDKPTENSAAVRRGRLIGIGAYAIFMTSVAGLWGIQVMSQVWFPEVAAVSDCNAGIATLRQGLVNASQLAREAEDEGAALAAFRAHIETLWPLRNGLQSSCAVTPGIEGVLVALDQRRYREEATLRLADGADARQEQVLSRFPPW